MEKYKKKRKQWTKSEILKEAKKYKSRSKFMRGSGGAYNRARKLGILDEVCQHMELLWEEKWNSESIADKAANFQTRIEFKKAYPNAYKAARRLNILDNVCQHMEYLNLPNGYWTKERVVAEASKYDVRDDFRVSSSGAWAAARTMGILDEVCQDMKKSAITSNNEQELFSIIAAQFPSAKTLRERNINMSDKPHIKGFDIDIYIPELKRGIEFDGRYWHKFDVMRKSKSKELWSDEDLENYHNIKDDFFRTRGIEILHIKEENWIEDKDREIKKAMEFLNQ